ncbi:putative membrane protein YoaS [Lysinibacillus sp. PLM2]|nr:putative membrane protein YoaS [Lysinibacillus sp. PLM2]
MKRGSTWFLKVAVFVIGTPVLAACIFLLPSIAKDVAEGGSEWAWVIYSLFIIMYVSAIPFFIALFQAFKLLSYIDKNKAFSQLSVTALKKIKYCATIIAGLYVFALPLFYIFADIDDAPGVVIVGMMFVFAPLVIAVFAAVLQKLLKEAIDIKSENDLTV